MPVSEGVVPLLDLKAMALLGGTRGDAGVTVTLGSCLLITGFVCVWRGCLSAVPKLYLGISYKGAPAPGLQLSDHRDGEAAAVGW